MADPRAALYADIAEYVEREHEPALVRFRDDPAAVLSWCRREGFQAEVFWQDVRYAHHLHGRAQTWPEVEAALWDAAEKALYRGQWLYALHLDTKLLPPDCAFLKRGPRRTRKRPYADVIPVGAATSLITPEALSSIFHCSLRTIERWLDEMSIPKLRTPGDRMYVSLWTVELCLLRKMIPELTWMQAAEMLKTAQTVYGAAQKSSTVQRLRELATKIKPNSRLLQRAAKRRGRLKQGK